MIFQAFVPSIDVKVPTSPQSWATKSCFLPEWEKTEVILVVTEPVHEHPGTVCLWTINSGPQQAQNRIEAASFDQVPPH